MQFQCSFKGLYMIPAKKDGARCAFVVKVYNFCLFTFFYYGKWRSFCYKPLIPQLGLCRALWSCIEMQYGPSTHWSLLKSYYIYIYILVSHRSEYTLHIFVNVLLYLFMWQHWRNYTLLQCKVVSVQLV